MNLSKDTQSTPVWRGQWLGYICLAMLVFYTWLPNSYYLMVSYPWIIVWQVGFLALGIWTIWMLRQFKTPFKLLGYGLDWAVGAIMVAVILSGLFAPFKTVSAWNISLVFCYLMLVYVLRNWLSVSSFDIYQLWQRISIVGVISCLVGLAIWILIWYPSNAFDLSRINHPMGHPNFVAGYIMLVLPVTIALAVARKGWRRIGAFTASSLMLFVLYCTGSRGGFLGLSALVFVSVIFFIIRGQGKQRWLRLGGCSLILIIFLTFALSNSRVQRIVKINGFNSGAPLIQLKIDGQSKDRLLMLQAASNILKDRPLFGVGVGNMSRVYDLYRPIETGTGATQVQQLHNTPVQIFGESGLVGFSAYLFLIACLLQLWFKLYFQLSTPQERYLLYGIGGSFLAYGVATLTDYQLENITLSSHLIVFGTILLELANINNLKKTKTFSNYFRRFTSLIIITTLVASWLLWIPQTLALRLSKMGYQDFLTGKLSTGYEKVSFAAGLVSWDPSYNLIAAIRAMQIREPVKEEKLYQELTELSLEHLKKVIAVAPNDHSFNQMLGMMYRDIGDSKSAIKYFRRTLQLIPRSSTHSHYLLGSEYLKVNEREKAITALALQGLIMPQFLSSSMWKEPPLSNVKNEVFQKSLNLFSELLEQIPSNQLNYADLVLYDSIYEKKIILEWWNERLEKEDIEYERLRPLVRAFLLAEQEPDKALEIINSNIKSADDPDSLLLLKAWIQPEPYIYEYLKTNSGKTLKEFQKQDLINITKQKLDLKSWISTLQLQVTNVDIQALKLTYRNQEIETASLVLLPEELKRYFVIEKLGLFDPYYREIPELEHIINRVQTKELSLPHVTLNNSELETNISK